MILQLTDGDTTLDFVWHSVTNRGFLLTRGAWQPRVARRRRSQLGGSSPYGDVVEEIGLTIAGDTAAALLASQQDLIRLLDQAEQWAAGAPVRAVLLRYGLSSDTYEAAVLGPGAGDESALGLTPAFNAEIGMLAAAVRLRVRRRGLWTLPPRCINLLANWSFESDMSTTPGGWTSGAVAPGVAAHSVPAVGAAHGTGVRGLQNTNAGGTALLYQDVSGLTVGASYRVSVYAYRSAGSGNVGLTAYDGGGTANAVSATTTAASWARLEVTKVCPAGGSIRVALTAAGTTTGVFDAALLEILPASGTATPITSIDGARSPLLAGAAVLHAVFGEDVAIPSPIRAQLTRTNSSGTEQQGTFEPCVWALTNAWAPALGSTLPPAHLNIVAAGGMAGGGVGQYTAVAVNTASAPFARNATLLRYTPTTTAEVKTALANSLDNLVTSAAPLAFLTVQASVDSQFTVRGYLGSVVGASDLAPAAIASDPVTVGGTARQVIALRWPEVVANLGTAQGLKFRLGVESTAAAGTLDIDSILFVATDQHPRVIQAYTASGDGLLRASETVILAYLDSGLNVSSGLMSSAAYRLVVDPRVVAAPEGVVGVTRSDEAWDAGLAALGTPDLYLSGWDVACAWLAPEGSNWRYTTGGNLVSNQLIVTRRKAVLVPS